VPKGAVHTIPLPDIPFLIPGVTPSGYNLLIIPSYLLIIKVIRLPWIFDIRPSKFLQRGVIVAHRPLAGDLWHMFADRDHITIATLGIAARQAIILQ